MNKASATTLKAHRKATTTPARNTDQIGEETLNPALRQAHDPQAIGTQVGYKKLITSRAKPSVISTHPPDLPPHLDRKI